MLARATCRGKEAGACPRRCCEHAWQLRCACASGACSMHVQAPRPTSLRCILRQQLLKRGLQAAAGRHQGGCAGHRCRARAMPPCRRAAKCPAASGDGGTPDLACASSQMCPWQPPYRSLQAATQRFQASRCAAPLCPSAVRVAVQAPPEMPCRGVAPGCTRPASIRAPMTPGRRGWQGGGREAGMLTVGMVFSCPVHPICSGRYPRATVLTPLQCAHAYHCSML